MPDIKELDIEELDKIAGGNYGPYKDEILVCKDCGKTFVYTAKEQMFNSERGFLNEPQLCNECKNKRKGGERCRELFRTTCALCGKEISVPYKPEPDRPIYCENCRRTMD